MKGLDLSYANKLTSSQYDKISEFDFVILRLGYGRQMNIDNLLTKHYAEIMSRNPKMKFGYYFFSYANTLEEAKQEAFHSLAIIEKFKLKVDLPIFWDYEYASDKTGKVDRTTLTAMAYNFCNIIEERGFKAGVYLNRDFYVNRYHAEIEDLLLWFAYYNEILPPDMKCAIWQKSSKYNIYGVFVDYNEAPEDLNLYIGWQLTVEGEWMYRLSDGVRFINGWRQIKGRWYYFRNSIAVRNCVKCINGKLYAFGPDCWMLRTVEGGEGELE